MSISAEVKTFKFPWSVPLNPCLGYQLEVCRTTIRSARGFEPLLGFDLFTTGQNPSTGSTDGPALCDQEFPPIAQDFELDVGFPVYARRKFFPTIQMKASFGGAVRGLSLTIRPEGNELAFEEGIVAVFVDLQDLQRPGCDQDLRKDDLIASTLTSEGTAQAGSRKLSIGIPSDDIDISIGKSG